MSVRIDGYGFLRVIHVLKFMTSPATHLATARAVAAAANSESALQSNSDTF